MVTRVRSPSIEDQLLGARSQTALYFLRLGALLQKSYTSDTKARSSGIVRMRIVWKAWQTKVQRRQSTFEGSNRSNEPTNIRCIHNKSSGRTFSKWSRKFVVPPWKISSLEHKLHFIFFASAFFSKNPTRQILRQHYSNLRHYTHVVSRSQTTREYEVVW